MTVPPINSSINSAAARLASRLFGPAPSAKRSPTTTWRMRGRYGRALRYRQIWVSVVFDLLGFSEGLHQINITKRNNSYVIKWKNPDDQPVHWTACTCTVRPLRGIRIPDRARLAPAHQYISQVNYFIKCILFPEVRLFRPYPNSALKLPQKYSIAETWNTIVVSRRVVKHICPWQKLQLQNKKHLLTWSTWMSLDTGLIWCPYDGSIFMCCNYHITITIF